jgi:hypothetical protein
MDHVQLENLPNGLVVLYFPDLMQLGDGLTATEYRALVWTGHTLVTASSNNQRSAQPLEFSGPPLLTLDQVRQLALDPDFALYG